jgi:hypothetical protein
MGIGEACDGLTQSMHATTSEISDSCSWRCKRKERLAASLRVLGHPCCPCTERCVRSEETNKPEVASQQVSFYDDRKGLCHHDPRWRCLSVCWPDSQGKIRMRGRCSQGYARTRSGYSLRQLAPHICSIGMTRRRVRSRNEHSRMVSASPSRPGIPYRLTEAIPSSDECMCTWHRPSTRIPNGFSRSK